MSEHNSTGSRHRRKSFPNMLGSSRGSRRSRSSPRAGSVDPLLDGSLSDGGDSGTLHLSVSRGDLDRADTRSEARSYNETIIRPVTRRLNTPAGTSYRSSRSHATTSEVRSNRSYHVTFFNWIGLFFRTVERWPNGTEDPPLSFLPGIISSTDFT